ncbi:ATP-binding protein [Streptomyces sp. NPDC059452]|uniref:ATP-binding protein n=1 Tax=Streptomyces sp. NPDC059452 TaxID=3346835 RepID=UPI00369DA837
MIFHWRPACDPTLLTDTVVHTETERAASQVTRHLPRLAAVGSLPAALPTKPRPTMSQSPTQRRQPDSLAPQRERVRSKCEDLPVTAAAFQMAFRPDPRWVSETRRTTAAFLRRAPLPEPLVSDVVLAVSELVTNAIVHGGGDVCLRVSVDSQEVRVSVSDQSPERAVLVHAEDDRESGRGVLLVAAFAQAWGSSGAETWCSFRHPDKSVAGTAA